MKILKEDINKYEFYLNDKDITDTNRQTFYVNGDFTAGEKDYLVEATGSFDTSKVSATLDDGYIDIDGEIEVDPEDIDIDFIDEDTMEKISIEEASKVYGESVEELENIKKISIKYIAERMEYELTEYIQDADHFYRIFGDDYFDNEGGRSDYYYDRYADSRFESVQSNPLKKQAAYNKKHNKKSSLPFVNKNAGNVKAGNKFFNKATSTGDVPTSATADGTIGAAGAMGESIEDTKTFKVQYIYFPNPRRDDYEFVTTTIEADSKEDAYQKVRKKLNQNRVYYRDLLIY